MGLLVGRGAFPVAGVPLVLGLLGHSLADQGGLDLVLALLTDDDIGLVHFVDELFTV